MKSRGPFVPVGDAVKMADISMQSLRNYVDKGYLELHFAGGMVYYRELLEAAWMAKQDHLNNSGRPSKQK